MRMKALQSAASHLPHPRAGESKHSCAETRTHTRTHTHTHTHTTHKHQHTHTHTHTHTRTHTHTSHYMILHIRTHVSHRTITLPTQEKKKTQKKKKKQHNIRLSSQHTHRQHTTI